MHTYISKWTYLCMYTKMSLELVLQGLCRFFFLFFFLFYIKGFTSAVGLQFLQLLVEEMHSLAGSFITAAWSSHLNTSPPSTPPLHRRVHIVGITWTTWETHVRVSCWDMSDSAVFCWVFFPPSVTVMEEQHLESYTADRGINVWKCAIIKNALCALVMSHTRVVCWLLLA